jgi:hypothetical protein
VDDVSVARRGGGLFMIATAVGCPRPDSAGPGTGDPPQNGILLQARHGVKRVVADITAFECANDPERQGPESNPYSLFALSNRHQVVADTAGDSILDVHNGKTSRSRLFPPALTGPTRCHLGDARP